MIFERIIEAAPGETVIPKPAAKMDFKVKGLGRRRGEPALIYYIPNHQNPQKPYQKGINRSEFEMAYSHLMETGYFSRSWFAKHLPFCNAEGDCNFTTIGGLFEKIGEAKYIGNGEYKKIG